MTDEHQPLPGRLPLRQEIDIGSMSGTATRQIGSESRSDDLTPAIRTVLTRIAVGEHVSSAEISDAFRDTVGLLAPTRDVVLGSLMTAVMKSGPVANDVEELLRVALSLDKRAPVEVISGSDRPVVMLAGSGKKGVRTLNVSTPAALVAAAAGAQVIKVGSAATSSALGSRDLVRALGLDEHSTAHGVRTDLRTSGFAFVAIEPTIPVLDQLYGGRFHAPNPFSFGLALLASPVRGDVAVFGLAHPSVEVAARTLSRMGMDHVEVLTTRLPTGHYLDEIGLAGEVRSCRVRNGEIRSFDLPMMTDSPAELHEPQGPEEAVERTVELLTGGGIDSHRAIVALNAGHLLMLGGVAASLQQGRDLADEILRSGVTMANGSLARTAERSA